ncbi:GvpL/GvpF family gas vesicle protein [Alteribacillus sp. HJP-4]|uniref:GvpL/GvpF family gas vesicle protein n=1 Tax=Alteribacillus sp. HJP-4 TaxID=2775394 RepID=UPI0035CD18B5
MSEELGVYMFCVIEENQPQKFGHATLAGGERPVYTIHKNNRAMVVADAPIQIYDPSRKNLKAHQEIVEKVMKDYDIIPMSFGNVLQGQEDILILMDKLDEQFDEIFPKIKNKIEVGLKVIGNKEWLSQKANQQPNVKALQNRMQGKEANASYYDRMQLGESAHKFMIALHSEFEEEVFQPLAKIADAAKSNEVISERMLLNASFLVDKKDEEAFDKKVNKIYNEWEDKADFKYTGPWPAYNFIDIKLKAKDPT